MIVFFTMNRSYFSSCYDEVIESNDTNKTDVRILDIYWLDMIERFAIKIIE